MNRLILMLISADAQNKEITVRLKGDADFVWAVDTVKLLEEMMNYKGKIILPFSKLSRH